MKKFIQIVPRYNTSSGLLKKEDYMAISSNAMAEKGYLCEYVIPFRKLSKKDKLELKKNLRKDVSILTFGNWISYFSYLLKNKDAIFFANDRILESFIVGLIAKNSFFMSHQSNLPKSGLKRSIFLFFANRFSMLKVSNPFEKKELVRFGVPENKIKYIPLAIDSDFFSKRISKSKKSKLLFKYAIVEDEFIILFLATIRKFKNPYTVIDAIKILKEKGLKFRLLIVGKDKLADEGGPTLKEYAEEKKVSDKIIFTGNLHPEQIVEIFNISDLSVNSSFHEGQCLTVYESAAAGIPLCLPTIGSFTSVFSDSALFHNPSDYKKLAENIIKYAQDRYLVIKHSEINKNILKKIKYEQIKKMLVDFFIGRLQ